MDALKCKCGGEARIRHKSNHTWVECKKKTCDVRTGFIYNWEGTEKQEEVDNFAISMWNRLVSKDG